MLDTSMAVVEFLYEEQLPQPAVSSELLCEVRALGAFCKGGKGECVRVGSPTGLPRLYSADLL